MPTMQAPARIRLEILEIPEPCPADWSAMTVVDGDRTRFCRDCRKHVYNLSEMPRESAERFIADRFASLQPGDEGVCIRLYRRADGTVVTADCDGAWRRATRRARAGWLAVAALPALPALMASSLRGNRADVITVRPPPPQVNVTALGGCVMVPMQRPPATQPVNPPTTSPAPATGG